MVERIHADPSVQIFKVYVPLRILLLAFPWDFQVRSMQKLSVIRPIHIRVLVVVGMTSNSHAYQYWYNRIINRAINIILQTHSPV
jgi:hypothetical protein